MLSSNEIQNRVKSGYIERLGTRLKKMRKQLIDRDWTALKTEASHVADGAHQFGFADIAEEVNRAIGVLNQRSLSRTAIDAQAKITLEALFQRLDRFLHDEIKQ